MRMKLTTASLAVAGVLATGIGISGQQTPARPPTVFRTSTNLVRVDVVVRDKNGNVVKGLKDADFLVFEDNKAQQITSFDFEEIATDALPSMQPAPVVLGLSQLQNANTQRSRLGGGTSRRRMERSARTTCLPGAP